MFSSPGIWLAWSSSIVADDDGENHDPTGFQLSLLRFRRGSRLSPCSLMDAMICLVCGAAIAQHLIQWRKHRVELRVHSIPFGRLDSTANRAQFVISLD
ncbi:hypothetical protein BDW42DRAFT_181160 [Aspergillus taichungensis]|uniref:Uncharacterized protein n=1 Tax=Aspergillus taichungensis TaxID=482145 RepID=A0A2J5HEA2_9EURO|nr:hypothetical protein BDW42DRAFT_181160 [Aspergillus taichungensis]